MELLRRPVGVVFTNTVGSRGGTPEEHIRTFGDVLSWAETRGVIDRAEAQFEPSGGSALAEPILTPVIRAAIDLVTSDALARVRHCADRS